MEIVYDSKTNSIQTMFSKDTDDRPGELFFFVQGPQDEVLSDAEQHSISASGETNEERFLKMGFKYRIVVKPDAPPYIKLLSQKKYPLYVRGILEAVDLMRPEFRSKYCQMEPIRIGPDAS